MITEDLNRLKILNKMGYIDDELLKAKSNKPLINIEKLHVNFKRNGKLFEAVKNANLQIHEGEILGLVGESGSGKTTLGRATISLWDHALGKVEIDGREVPSKRIRSVSKKNLWVYESGQMIFQDPTSSLNRQSKVMDIVSEGMDNFDTVRKEYKAKLGIESAKLGELTKIMEILDTKELKDARVELKKVTTKLDILNSEVEKTTEELKQAKADLKVKTKEGDEAEIKTATSLVDDLTNRLADEKEALKEVKKEVTQANKEFDKVISEVGDEKPTLEQYTQFALKKARREFIIELISETEDKAIVAMINDHARESEIRDEVEALWEKSKHLKEIAKKKISIIKARVASEKRILSEEAEADIKSFKEDMRHEIEEYKLLEERNDNPEEDNEKVVERLKKRIHRFYVKSTKIKNELPSDLKSKFPKDTEDLKKIKALIKDLNTAIKSKSKLNEIQSYYAKSLVLILELIIKKRDKVVTPINTTAFDHNYLYLNEVFAKRVHYFEKLIVDLDARLKIEQEKLDNTDQKETLLVDFYTHSIEYLKEYRELLVSYVAETESISLKCKEELLNHESNIESIKNFYKWLMQQSKVNDELKVSIATWRAEKAIEYTNRSLPKDDREIVLQLEKLQAEADEISSKYEHILNPRKELSKLIKDQVDEFEASFKITPAEYKKQLKGLTEIEDEINEIKDRVIEYDRIIKDKKLLNEKKVELIKETLLKVGLNEDSLNKYPDQFSGGQKQRIGIARTIINKPKFIIADEPISALDVSVQAQVINLMKDINEEMGLTMLFIAHDLQMVHYISDKLAVIYRGNIVEYGDADKVYHSPRHPYTKSLIGAMPSLSEVGKPLEVSNYSWDQHEYNEFSIIKMHEVEEDHFVYGTDAEIKKWK